VLYGIVALPTNVNVGLARIDERLTQEFDHQPESKGWIAQTALEVDKQQDA
jgi:hypothetical protein